MKLHEILTPDAVDVLTNDLRAVPDPPPGDHLTPEDMLAYGMGTLSAEEASRLDDHLRGCEVCVPLLERHLTTVSAWEGPEGKARLGRLRLRLLPALRRLIQRSEGVGTPSSTVDADTSRMEERVLSLLSRADALEPGDYTLPSGHHASVHVNVGKTCHSEGMLQELASAFDDRLRATRFDSLISTGWTMAMVGRRLLQRRSARGQRAQHVIVEGYDPPALLGKVAGLARAVLLLDVVVTGRLVAALAKLIGERDGQVVKAMTLVDAASHGERPSSSPPIESLCRLSLGLHRPDECTWSGILSRFEFDPLTFRMVTRESRPRGIYDFLAEDPAAREFWALVDRAHAYEHHHREGRRHYLAFVDTARLLSHPVTGPMLVDKLRSQVVQVVGLPDVLLVPWRKRAVRLGRELANALGHGIPVVAAKHHARGFALPENLRNELVGRRVLVVDSAAGHGDTLDELILLAKAAAAGSVGTAVLLSRLSEACERAFDARLAGAFVRLFNVPIRPIYGEDARRCPVCREKIDIRTAAAGSPLRSIRELAEAATRKGWRHGKPNPRHGQEQLLISGSLLEGCRRGTASGVALHALHAARGDSVAPLSLTEITDRRIPHENRAAMIEHLPSGVICYRGGDALVADLTRSLTAGVEEDVWVASADVLTREGHSAWVDHLGEALEQAPRPLARSSWRRLTYDAYRLGRHGSAMRQRVEFRLQELVRALGHTPVGPGLRGMLEAVARPRA